MRLQWLTSKFNSSQCITRYQNWWLTYFSLLIPAITSIRIMVLAQEDIVPIFLYFLDTEWKKNILSGKKAKETFGIINFITSKTKQRWIYEHRSSHSSIDKWLLRISWARRTGPCPWGTDTKPLADRVPGNCGVGGTSWRLSAVLRIQPRFGYTLKSPKIHAKILISVFWRKLKIYEHIGPMLLFSNNWLKQKQLLL